LGSRRNQVSLPTRGRVQIDISGRHDGQFAGRGLLLAPFEQRQPFAEPLEFADAFLALVLLPQLLLPDQCLFLQARQCGSDFCFLVPI
jgi:hypothetical protein